MRFPDPVSYTHLDVYKRQVHESARFQIDRRQHAAVAEVVDDPVSSYSHVCCQQSSLSVLEESDRSYGCLLYTSMLPDMYNAAGHKNMNDT